MPQAYCACAQSFLALLQTDKNLFYKWIETYAIYSTVFESTCSIKSVFLKKNRSLVKSNKHFQKVKNITDSISLKST